MKKMLLVLGPPFRDRKSLETKKTQVKPNANRGWLIKLVNHIRPQLTRLCPNSSWTPTSQNADGHPHTGDFNAMRFSAPMHERITVKSQIEVTANLKICMMLISSCRCLCRIHWSQMSRMKMYSEQCRQAILQLHLSDQQVYCPLRCAYIIGVTVCFVTKLTVLAIQYDGIDTGK